MAAIAAPLDPVPASPAVSAAPALSVVPVPSAVSAAPTVSAVPAPADSIAVRPRFRRLVVFTGRLS
jgi:hypothetical protein